MVKRDTLNPFGNLRRKHTLSRVTAKISISSAISAMTLAFTVAAKQLLVYTLETWFIMIGHQKSYCGATREELVALTQSADTTVLTFTYYVTSLNDSFNLKASIWDEIIGFLAIFLGDTGYCEYW